MAKKRNQAAIKLPPAASTAGGILLLFLLVCLSVSDCIKPIAMITIIPAIAGSAFYFRRLRDRLHLPLTALILLTVMSIVSMVYSASGKFAFYGVLRLVLSLGAVLLMTLAPGSDAAPGRKAASAMAGSAAMLGLISIDLLSTRWISTPILGFLNLFSSFYQDMTAVEPGVRMVSILENPNIFAGCVGIGVLLSLGLTQSARSDKERRFDLCCLYLNSLSFVLSFSMGATASIVLAFVVYLILEHQDRRFELLRLMVLTLVIALVGMLPISMTAMELWDGFQPIPLLCTVFGCVLLCLADRFVGRRLAERLKGKTRLLLICAVVLLVLLAAFAIVAYNWTGPVDLAAGENLSRAIYPEPGDYTIAVQGSGDVHVTIESQNQYDTMMHTAAVLYEGPLGDAAFTVPADTQVVKLHFRADSAAALMQVVLDGADHSVSVPLGYRLLPGFIANRLQGLFANQNAIQRLVFFRDGIKLFRASPILGHGIGSFETLIYSVQDFFYETKYVHNHYIQTMLETGIVGLIMFLFVLVSSAAAVVAARKQSNFHPFVPALGAAVLFIAAHCAVEVVFSSCFYLIYAFGVFGLINLCCGHALSFPKLGKMLRTGILAVAAAVLLVFTFLLGRNMQAADLLDRSATLTNLEAAIRMDKFEWPDYAAGYILNALQADETDTDIHQKADQYAQRLSEQTSNSIHLYLTRYQLERGRVEQAMEHAMTHAQSTVSSSEKWNELFRLLEDYQTDDPAYLNGIAALADCMQTWNDTHMGAIVLDETSQTFLNRVLEAQ